jgi:hypothetical protein
VAGGGWRGGRSLAISTDSYSFEHVWRMSCIVLFGQPIWVFCNNQIPLAISTDSYSFEHVWRMSCIVLFGQPI